MYVFYYLEKYVFKLNCTLILWQFTIQVEKLSNDYVIKKNYTLNEKRTEIFIEYSKFLYKHN